MSGNLGRGVDPNSAFPAFFVSGFESTSGNGSTKWSHRSDSLQPPSLDAGGKHDKNKFDEEMSKELNLFVLKPIFRDSFDKIELSWSVQNTKTQEPAIRDHMDKNEENGIPSVMDMLENLHVYEEAIVVAELSGTSSRLEILLLSLKRTKTDIQHREIYEGSS